MKLAYLILCHKDPEQVVRLIDSLDNAASMFVVHVDGRSNEVANELRASLSDRNNIFFVKRYRCYWGCFGIVQATISCINEIVRHNFDYAFLISGQDYPLKSRAYVEDFLAKNSNGEFIEAFPLLEANRWSDQEGPYNPEYRASGLVLSMRGRVFPTKLKRRMPFGYIPHGGSQWWCLSRSAISYIADFIIKHPRFVRYCRFSFIPDEMFFQTLLANSKFKSRIATSTTYVDFKNPIPPYPKTLDEGDLNHLSDQAWLFGRKFETDKSRNLITMLELQNQGK